MAHQENLLQSIMEVDTAQKDGYVNRESQHQIEVGFPIVEPPLKAGGSSILYIFLSL